MLTSFKGAAKRLDDIDLPRIGHRIGVGEDEIHALMDVEAPGSGFDSLGRPKMLFEPHRFYALLPAGPMRDDAVRQGLAYPKWGTKPYPAESYTRLAAAMKIAPAPAIRASSWGRGQIMGDNASLAGFDSAEEMVAAMMEDEEVHIDAMVSFVKATGIDDDLRAHRWEVVARIYNGPSYAVHNYHGRLAAAYAKWAKIRDTPFDPAKDMEAGKGIPLTRGPSADELALDRIVGIVAERAAWPAAATIARIRDTLPVLA